ncbi:MAG: YgiT-type zinc finger protein [Methanophagales archaeon]|nr:YgiT-type zinc finger protein [Methanophagales archaeon]
MRLKTCPECGGKMGRGKTKFVTEASGVLIVIEDVSADICIECGAEYLPSEVDKYVEGVVEDIIANKVKPSMEEVYRIAVRMREKGVV